MLQEEVRQLISAYGYGVIAGIVGLEGMDTRATGSITWAAAFGLAAYLLGDQAQRLTAPLGVAGIVIALAAGALIALRRRERRWRQLARAHYDKALPPSARNS